MVQASTVLKVVDNSGAQEARCIGVLGASRIAGVGDIISVAVTKGSQSRSVASLALPSGSSMVGNVLRGILVRTKSPIRRKVGRLSFGENAIVLLDKSSKPMATKVSGQVCREAGGVLEGIVRKWQIV